MSNATHYRRNEDGTRSEVEHEEALEPVVFGETAEDSWATLREGDSFGAYQSFGCDIAEGGAHYGYSVCAESSQGLREGVAQALLSLLEDDPDTCPLVLGSARSVLKAVRGE